jgi:hypothetical protein
MEHGRGTSCGVLVSGGSFGDRVKEGVALWLYRYGLVNGIIGSVIALLSFDALYTIALSGWMQQSFGISYLGTYMIMTFVTFVGFFGGGYVLDKHIRYWMANAKIGTSRNQFLVNELYNKEIVFTALDTIPHLKALRLLVSREPPSTDRDKMIDSLDTSIARLERAVHEKRFELQPHERAY